MLFKKLLSNMHISSHLVIDFEVRNFEHLKLHLSIHITLERKIKVL